MYGDARYVLFIFTFLNLFLFMSATDTDISTSRCRSKRHLLPLLGYLHGYKIGQNFALQLPPFVLSPVFILPSVNQQQSVNVQKSTSGENYQESGGTFQNISPARLIAKTNETNSKVKEVNQSLSMENNTNIELLISKGSGDLQSESDSFRQANFNQTNVTDTPENMDEIITTTSYAEATEIDFENLKINSTEPHGPYPNAVYHNENLNNLTLTVDPIQYNLSVPNADDRWQNFNRSSNEFENNNTKNNINIAKDFVYPTTESYLTETRKFYPYPRSWYNSKVDRLSITSNSYTNEEAALPPSYDDRWQRFSSLRKSYPMSGFRPLAGLYYDGFLHKSLTKEMGFMPYRYNGYYYN